MFCSATKNIIQYRFNNFKCPTVHVPVHTIKQKKTTHKRFLCCCSGSVIFAQFDWHTYIDIIGTFVTENYSLKAAKMQKLLQSVRDYSIAVVRKS